MQATLLFRDSTSTLLQPNSIGCYLRCLCSLTVLTLSLSGLSADGHMIASPSLPLNLNEAPVNDTAVKFQWPTERDERLRPLETGRFSRETMTLAGVPSRFNFQFDVRELSDQRSEQPFYLGAPFGQGLLGFHFNDFGPVGQEFALSQFGDQQFGGFVPLSKDFGGFGRFGNNGSNGSRNSSARANALASGGAAGGNGSVDLASGAYNPFAFRYLYVNSYGDGGQASASEQSQVGFGLIDGHGLIDHHRGLFDGGITLIDFGITDMFGLPRGGPLWFIGWNHPCPDWDWCPPPYSGCGPFDHDTPILGLPLGILGPFLGPLGPFDLPFWLHVHHNHHHHPHCVPAPSALVMLLSLLPNLGLAYGVRRVVRSRRAKKSVA